MFGMLTMTIQHKGQEEANLTTNTGIHTQFSWQISNIQEIGNDEGETRNI